MPSRQADRPTPPSPAWRHIRHVLLALLIMGTLAWALARHQKTIGRNLTPAGFSHGLQHGALMPCALPLLLLGRDVIIYAPHNPGRSYNLGYTMGVNACGLVFFGFLFSRLARWRKCRSSAPEDGCCETKQTAR
jgi:hypothetical protein